MIQKQIDKNYCEHVRTVLNEIGIDVSADVQIFYKPVEHEKRIPLDLAAVRKSECRKASIVGAVLALSDNYGGRKLQRTLQKQGYTAYLY